MYWTIKITDGPTGDLTAAICIGDNIYCFGDMLNPPHRVIRGSPVDHLDAFILNTQTLRWTRLPVITDENGAPPYYPEVPSRKSGSAAVAYEDKIYIFGWPNASLYCFDTKTLGWSRPAVTGTIPAAHFGDTASVVGHFMYIFSGFSYGTDRTVPFLDFKTFEWRSLQPIHQLRSPFSGRAPVSINGRIYMIDESFESYSYAHMVYFDVNTQQWHRPVTNGNRPPCQLFQSLFVYNGLIYTFHGVYLYSFDPTSNLWCAVTAYGVKPLAIGIYFCVTKDTKMFFLGDTRFQGRVETRILDFQPNLRTLSILAVAQHKVDTSCLPRMLQEEVRTQTEEL